MGYFQSLGFPIMLEEPQSLEWKIVIGRNEIDYRSAARFSETLDVYTRIAWIRNTSYALQGFIEEAKTKRLIAENVSIHVWLDKVSDKPIVVPDFFRKMVRQFEGDDVLISPVTVMV
jgi:acyl-CoA thioesterase FadM